MNQPLLYGLIALILLGVGYGAYTQFYVGIPEDAPQEVTEDPNAMEIKVALLDTTGEGAGPKRACDSVNMVTRVVPRSDAPLNAALVELFAMPEGAQPGTNYNFLARTRDTLKFESVTITDGTANIYLTGSLSGLAGICDDPRAEIQLEETALQFPTVQSVQLYLNGEKTNLTPVGQGS